MKEEKTIRKRFHKPYHFLAKAGPLDIGCLTEIFQNFHLDDFRQQINLWQELALCNEQSAYGEGWTREDLIDFIKELHKLIEAFHILNKETNHQKKKKKIKGLPKQTKKMLSKMNVPVLLTEEEKTRPGLVIKQFCKTFKQAYAKMELLDMLDAAITYEGDKTLYKGNLVLFYQHVHYLIKLAYNISKNKRLINH